MFKKGVNFARRLAGKFSIHRNLFMLAYIILLGLTLPTFYPAGAQEIVGQHNGVMLGLGILMFITLLILDSTALYDGDDDLLDQFTDAWIDLDDEHKRQVVDNANAVRDMQIREDLENKIQKVQVNQG